MSPIETDIDLASFDPNVESVLPEGKPPFIENDAPVSGTEHTTLRKEGDKLIIMLKVGRSNTSD